MIFSRYTPKRVQKSTRAPWRLPVLLAAVLVSLGLLMAPNGGGQAHVAEALPPAAPSPTPSPTPEPTPSPTPTPSPAFDFTRPAPEGAPVDMEYFSDALLIGDSRTEGLRLYSGIQGAHYYCYKGITVFEMDTKAVIELEDGEKYTVLEALERGEKYAKIYISLGVNELGAEAEIYEASFSEFLDQVKVLQPQAVIYLETVVPVNPAKCAANRQPGYVTNEKVYAFNEVLLRLAEEKRVALLDIAGFFSDENGVLAEENTVDGVHFTKDIYQQWLAYLMNHTVDPAEYAAGQSLPPAPGGTEVPAGTPETAQEISQEGETT